MSDRKILRPYQSEAIEQMRQSRRRGNRRIVCELPTGGGKAVTQTHMAWNNQVMGGSGVLLIAPRKELVRQNGKQLWDHGLRAFGTIRGGVAPTPMMPVQVATAQALAARRVKPKANLIMVDECHMRSELIDQMMRDDNPDYGHATFVGFSASPWRKGMGKQWDDLIIGATTQGLIDQGFLVPFETYASPSGLRPDLDGIRTVVSEYGPDFQKEALAAAMSKPKLIADVVETYRQLARGRKTVMFASSCAHAKLLQEQLSAAGVFAAYMDANTPDDERDAIKVAMERGQTEVVVNVDVLTTGVDWPFIDCIQIARPTKSEMRWVQTIGRGLRICAGKQNCRIIDHTDSWARLGDVTDIHHDELDDGSGTKTAPKQPKEEAKPKECPKCHFIKPVRTPTCPKCGFQAQVQAKVTVLPGKLEKVGKRKGDLSQAEMERWYRELIGYALRHGQKPGAAYYRFSDKFGHFPSNRYSKVPLDPGPEVLGWMKHHNIRRAKSRNNPNYAGVSR